jgi:hypothetical protein
MNKTTLPIINSHNSWSRLEEVWLGDVYPAGWYSHLNSQTRDVFSKLTEITQQDLSSIQTTLESFDIVVRRPLYNCIDEYIDVHDQLVKPEICPRDNCVVIGNKLIIQHNHKTAWQSLLDMYNSSKDCSVENSYNQCINGANVVRIGRDIIIDRDMFDYTYHNEYPEYRVQVVSNGGHLDGCFAILKPGLILANHYYEDYDRTFPGWEIIYLDNPTYHAAPSTGYQQPYPVFNGKFFDTTFETNQMFNDHVIQHALDWVGNYTETYFELNCLVIDEKNVIMLAENHKLADDLGQRGITVHWVPFRARSFWDGAMHCLTVDIRRQSEITDFFPERI